MARNRKKSTADDAQVSTAPKQDGPQHNKDSFREFVETVVFVVVLVVMLKMFLAEAFVIPTGSMATTLYGYHMDSTCEQCGYRLDPNAAGEADPQRGAAPVKTETAVCDNCRFVNQLKRP